MSELTTQLEQARKEITEKEAESKTWEERAAGLLQQLREERANLEVRLALEQYVESRALHSHSLYITITVGGLRATEASCE